ncbi:MAG: hypothetical protein LBU32_16460 [Clostridiales bacterium]|jgi:nitroreductase|nr:hypothetical protein [Clostridiales bacterium]
MTLYETIFTRRSVRQYDQVQLEASVLAEIRQAIDNEKQLPGQNARFEIVNADRLKGVAAPHAILAYSAGTDAALANIGYTLQGVDLHLQNSGYGSLWMGMGKPIEQSADYRILLAFGKTSAPLRAGQGDFKRKSATEISNEDNAIARVARLAPSAVNFQPWKLDFSPGKVVVRPDGGGIRKLLTGNLQKIDLGIILKCVELALEREGKAVTALTPKGGGKTFAVEVAFE